MFWVTWAVASIVCGIASTAFLRYRLSQRGVRLNWLFVGTVGYVEYKFYEWLINHGGRKDEKILVAHTLIMLNLLVVFCVVAFGMSTYARVYAPSSSRGPWFPKEQFVVGTYVAKYPFGTDTIQLFPNHLFSQEVDVGKSYKTAGRWAYNSRTGELTLDRGFSVTIRGSLKKYFLTPSKMTTHIERIPLFRLYSLHFDKSYAFRKIQ